VNKLAKNKGHRGLFVILIVLMMSMLFSSCQIAETVNEIKSDEWQSDTTNGNLETEKFNTSTPKSTTKPKQGSTTKPQNTSKPVKDEYAIYVNKQQNVITIYKADSSNKFTIPYKVMLCSTGRANNTPVGTFKISDKYTWRPLVGGVYGQYACRFADGGFLFHSIPYTAQDKSTMKYGEYNKLGTAASDGCVRLRVADAKWIYDNCESGTVVVVYEDSNPGPLGKPVFAPIPDDLANWDPTDPDTRNPWKSIYPISIKGVKNT